MAWLEWLPRGSLIDPDAQPPARLDEAGQSGERPPRVRRVLEDTDAVDEVEALVREGRREDVGLGDLHVAKAGGVAMRGLDGVAEIDSEHLACVRGDDVDEGPRTAA